MSSEGKSAMGEENGEKSALVPRLRFPEFLNGSAWQLYTLGSIGETISGLSGKSAEDFGKGSPFVTYRQIFENSFVDLDKCGFVQVEIGERQNEVCYGDILITGSSETPEEVGFASVVLEKPSVKTYLNSFCFAFRPKPETLGNSKFSQFLFHSPWYRAEVTNLAQGSTRFNISKLGFLKLGLPVPTQDEQQKIADCLSSLDELITAETQKLDALKTHKKGLMQQLFPREGESVPRLRFPEFREAGEWEEKPLAEVCNVLQGYGFPEVLQGRSEGKYPFCKVSDISRAVADRGGLLDEASNYVGDDDLLSLRAKLIPKGATVFAKIGEALRLNRRAYVQKECLIDNNTTGLKAIEGVADDYFVYLLSQLIDLNEHCGGAVPSVNKTTLEDIEVVVPGLDEQKRIAERLSPLDDLITTQSQKIDALKSHKKGLMQQLFPTLDEVPA